MKESPYSAPVPWMQDRSQEWDPLYSGDALGSLGINGAWARSSRQLVKCHKLARASFLRILLVDQQLWRKHFLCNIDKQIIECCFNFISFKNRCYCPDIGHERNSRCKQLHRNSNGLDGQIWVCRRGISVVPASRDFWWLSTGRIFIIP